MIETKQKILEAALKVIRTRGYTATTIDDLCSAAGVTKGAFFHHFASKEALAVAAANYWSEVTSDLFAHAPYQKQRDPLDRLLGYVDFRKNLVKGTLPEFTCFVGTMVQETYQSNPAIREACRQSIFGHAATLEEFIKQAKGLYAPRAKWSVESLAQYTQVVIQGAFVLAKASENPEIATESILHLRHYIEFLFSREQNKRKHDYQN